MRITVYGITNCDTVRKARKWLQREGVEYAFHDLRADGLTPAILDRWLEHCGWESLLNRRSTTWKALPPDQRERLDRASARILMLANPTLVKRPVTDTGKRVLVGFDEQMYQTEFGRR